MTAPANSGRTAATNAASKSLLALVGVPMALSTGLVPRRRF